MQREPEFDEVFDSEETSSERNDYVVDEDQAGQRLDRFLVGQMPHVSRTQVQNLIDEGRVRVGGIAKKPSHHLEQGETVTVEIPAPQLPGVEPEDIPLDILYRDDDIAVIHKPAGMIVHPGAGEDRGTLVAALLYYFGGVEKLSSVGGPIRPGIVHRIDKGTSGLLIVALTDEAHRKLVDEFRERRVQKTYVALLHGKLSGESGTIELPISRDIKRRSRMTTRRGEGREARTDWRLRLRFDHFAFIEADLHTGRTHQIRVHFSALGSPVVGDTLYGAPRQERVGHELLPPLDRNFLHAARIGFEHPTTRKPIEFRAPLPPDLQEYLKRLGRATQSNPAAIDAALKEFL
jgi:23S rRNA pseudouridine1911/1915/1917 synthase